MNQKQQQYLPYHYLLQMSAQYVLLLYRIPFQHILHLKVSGLKFFLAGVELTSNDTLYACPASTVTSLTMACPCHLLSPPHERSVSKPLYSTPRTSSVEVFF